MGSALGGDKPSNTWFGVSPSKSAMLSLLLVHGWLFKIHSILHNKFVYNHLMMILLFVIDSSQRLILFTSDFQLPPIHGIRGGINLHLIPSIVRKLWTLLWSKMLNLSLISAASLTKYAPLPGLIILKWRLIRYRLHRGA